MCHMNILKPLGLKTKNFYSLQYFFQFKYIPALCLLFTKAYFFPLHNRHGFLIDVKKVLGHLIEDNCNWPSVILILGENHWYP